MDLQRIAVKFFAADGPPVPLESVIPVFHAWIREQKAGGIPIDVSDYSHVPGGPGVVLIGHEADIFMDSAEGPFGLLYNRKRGLEGSVDDRWRTVFREALSACTQMEEDLEGKLKFRADEALVIFNDRLHEPDGETLDGLAKFTAELFEDGVSNTTPREEDSRSRQAIRVRGKATDVAGLLARLK